VVVVVVEEVWVLPWENWESAGEVGKSCVWMMRTGEYGWLRDLFRLVFGFHLDECEGRKSVFITV